LFAAMTWLVAMAVLTCAPVDVAAFEVAPARAYQVADLPVTLTVTAVGPDGEPAAYCGTATLEGAVRLDGDRLVPVDEITFTGGTATVTEVLVEDDGVTVRAGAVESTWIPDLRRLPGVVSILPPLFAIVLAIVFRQALLALFFGIWIGALFIHGWNPFTALLRCFDTYLPQTLVDSGHAAIVLFTMALGGMVGVIARSGGTQALVDAISRRARSRRSGMLTAWASGLIVFFDDYANCLLVGNTVRPFTDKLRVSREKLAYIVDSTAAPVATIALVSTWIGYQVGLFEDTFGTDKYGLAGKGYDLFLDILPYSFYSIFTLAFVAMIAVSMRDFGPMLSAERRAVETGELLRPGAQPLMDRELTDLATHARGGHWLTAIVPVASVILIVVIGLYASGRQALGEAASGAGLRTIIASADSYAVLLWAAFGGSVIALAMALGFRRLSLGDGVEAWVGGVKSMVMAVLILVLAWGLGTICKDYLLTGPWLLSQVQPSPHWLPAITFAVSAVIALATGSSFSTMAIVIPIAGPMAWELTGAASGLDAQVVESIRFATMAAVLGGAVFGDHCSPISDTTIMSSMSTAADHIDHVRTQAPYALLCGLVAVAVGFVPAGYGVSPWLTLPLGLVLLGAIVRLAGRRAEG
jgi:Na+/H+ antiporter NhaC